MGRIETNMTAIEIGLGLVAVSVSGITLGQLDVVQAAKVGNRLSEMSAVAILGTVAVLAIACVAYLIRVIMTKLLTALEESTKASQRVADTIERCEARK